MLKDLQNKCSPKEFKELCFCLTLNSITDHPDYKMWTSLSGRLKCFEKLRNNLKLIYPFTKEELKIENNSFNKFLKRYSIMKSFITDIHNKDSKNKSNNQNQNTIINSLLEDDTFFDNKNINLTIEDDTKLKTVRQAKDDNELATSQENILSKSIRNEKVSQSLLGKGNTKLFMSSESHPKHDQKLNTKEDAEIANSSSNKLSQENTIKEIKTTDEKNINIRDTEVRVKADDDGGDDDGISDDELADNKSHEKNTHQNDLSDLDKEEIFMKSCYEFYEYVKYINLY